MITDNYAGVNVVNFVNNMFFLRTENTALRVVMGSIWFMPVYFTVIPIGSLLISKIYTTVNRDEKYFLKLCRVALLIVFMGLIYTYLGQNFFYLSSTTLVYLLFYLLGVVFGNQKIKHFYSVLIIWVINFIILKIGDYFLGAELSNMQSLKFPPNILYVLYSFFLIVLAIYIKDKIKVSKKNIFCWVGRNSIYFYFCQGISSSMLMYIVPKINWIWYIKLPVAFVINVLLAFAFVLVFKRVCMGLEKGINVIISFDFKKR